ncbi:hypothetical protein ASD52_30335 [Ensifer sp. Root142]|uniref:hypothetical protein n=1 Tax=Ensifer sp. Root142 TaxID=1736461 RepID=UPI00070FBF85|nr:hypothetical protein [Ensifer sp. Root142]KQY70297.1 hypothetical protein ASD52_30335 [Ensifer sp. Root142]
MLLHISLVNPSKRWTRGQPVAKEFKSSLGLGGVATRDGGNHGSLDQVRHLLAIEAIRSDIPDFVALTDHLVD